MSTEPEKRITHDEIPYHESPYRSNRDPRVDALEHRMSLQESARVEQAAQTAALAEAQRTMREDVRDLINEMRRTNDSIGKVNSKVDETAAALIASVDKKFRNIGLAAWALVALLVPTVISLIGLWANS